MPERLTLDPVEQRVLGALLEKQRTVPDTYPLSLNALRSACNQSTSRDPVVDYDEPTLVDTLGRLRDRELVRFLKPTGLRVVKYHQRLEEQLGLDPEQAALIAVLLLRGPQTAGELRPRTERLAPFADREAVEAALRGMATTDPPLVRELERQPGQHDRRWIHLLGAEVAETAAPPATVDLEQVISDGAGARDRSVAADYDRLAEAYATAISDELDGKPFDRWLLTRLAEESGGGQGLDVGCGPGQIAAYLADHGVAMTGLDLSPAMIAEARTRHPDVSFVQGSFVVPPMPRGGDPRDPGWALISAWYAFVHLAPSELAPPWPRWPGCCAVAASSPSPPMSVVGCSIPANSGESALIWTSCCTTRGLWSRPRRRPAWSTWSGTGAARCRWRRRPSGSTCWPAGRDPSKGDDPLNRRRRDATSIQWTRPKAPPPHPDEPSEVGRQPSGGSSPTRPSTASRRRSA